MTVKILQFFSYGQAGDKHNMTEIEKADLCQLVAEGVKIRW